MLQNHLATPLVTRVLLLALPLLVVAKAAVFAGSTVIEKTALTDFDCFYLVGRMVWRGEITEAYHFPTMLRAQQELVGSVSFMPWAYPPTFNLVVAALACLPIWMAYLVFVGSTLGAFLLVLRRIAGDAFPAVLLLIYPILLITIGCGQNGFLTGTLIGLAALALAGQRAAAGLPLGLMVIKPHLAAAFALYAVASRRWACVALAVVVASFACGAATLVMGPTVWPAFLQGAAEAKGFLAAGFYPLFRMISVYALLRSFDAPAAIALAVQCAVALVALSMVLVAIRRGLPLRQVLGFTALASLLVSPYAYDYDLPIYGLALAFLMPDVTRFATSREQVAIVALSLFMGGYGLVSSAFSELSTIAGEAGRVSRPGLDETMPGMAGAILPVLVLLLWRIVAREAHHAADRSNDAPHHELPLAGRVRNPRSCAVN